MKQSECLSMAVSRQDERHIWRAVGAAREERERLDWFPWHCTLAAEGRCSRVCAGGVDRSRAWWTCGVETSSCEIDRFFELEV